MQEFFVPTVSGKGDLVSERIPGITWSVAYGGL